MKIYSSKQKEFKVKNYFSRTTICPLLKFFVLMHFFVNSVADCPSVCDCKWKDGKETIICNYLNLTSIPEKLDPGVLMFHFVGNSLLKLSDDIFRLAGLSNLQKLYLMKCNIKYIEPHAFRTLNNLVELDLSYNAISIVPSLAFVPIPDLRELKLNYNPILKMGDYAFTHVRQLIRLEVIGCRIGYVDQNAFSGLEYTLKWLKLNKNRIRNVKPETFTILNRLTDLDLSDNPLNCTCVLAPLRNWMSSRSMSTSSLPVCHFPEFNMNKSWDQLQSDDFACLPSVQVPVKIINAYEGENVTLMCRIGGNPAPEVSWTLRNRVLLNSTFGHPITKKRSYLIHSVSNNFSNLTILSLEMQDTGQYICIAENKAGRVIADIVLTIEKAPLGTILSERVVLIGILAVTILIATLCTLILFVRVMYCKNETSADIESKRRIISEKIEMKRNSSNMKQSSMVNVKREELQKTQFDETLSNKTDRKPYFNTILDEEDERKPSRPTNFNEIKMKSDSMEQNSPSSSIFESHIGEIALQHHVLHKKELPTGKLYTTAMAFMTDGSNMRPQKETDCVPSIRTKTTQNSSHSLGNCTTTGRWPKNVQSATHPTPSESQLSLMRNRYSADSSSDSMNLNTERITKGEYQFQREDSQNIPSSDTVNILTSGCQTYSSRSMSLDENKYWRTPSDRDHSQSSSSYSRTFDRKCDRKSEGLVNNFSNYSYSKTKTTADPALANTTYDYHVIQLERFLEEYRRLYSELSKMKETCEKFNNEDLNDYLYSKNRIHQNGRLKTSLTDPRNDSRSPNCKFDSKASIRRHLPLKSRSFDSRMQSKSSSFERSVSFVPTVKYDSVKSTVSDDVIVPKSILKNKNEEYRKSYNLDMPYVYSTLPLRRNRVRRFSDSSAERFFD